MKKLIIASAMALASVFALAVPTQAQSVGVTITTGDGPRSYRERERPRYYGERERPRRYSDDYRPRQVRNWDRPRHGCTVKKVRVWRDGQRVTRTTRVCR